MRKYDIAAYIWPAYTGKEPRSRIFWEEGRGEWQTVMNCCRKQEGYEWDRKPLWGDVDEADPKVMEYQIEQAVKHGVNVFIYDWYWYDRRPFLENCLNEGFLQANNRNDMKFYIMWANHNANYCWDKRLNGHVDCNVWLGTVDRREFDKITDRLIDKYFTQPNYYKINGKPVFMIYDADNLIQGLGGVENTKRALEDFRAKTIKAGFVGLELQLAAWGQHTVNCSGVDGTHTLSTEEVVTALGFDSITNYQFCHFADMDREYSEILKDVEREWARIDQAYKVPYYPHVSIGWDNNPRFDKYYGNVCKGNTPEAVEKAFRKAKAYVDNHGDLKAPLITVNSWNEWTETSYLEPDNKYGYGYLEAIKKVFLDEE